MMARSLFARRCLCKIRRVTRASLLTFISAALSDRLSLSLSLFNTTFHHLSAE